MNSGINRPKESTPLTDKRTHVQLLSDFLMQLENNPSTKLELDSDPKEGLDTGRQRTPRSRPTRPGRKALKKYKAALRLVETLGSKENPTLKEIEDLNWARDIINESRAHFEERRNFGASNPAFSNKIEEFVHKTLSEKRQRSVEEPIPITCKKQKNTTSTSATSAPAPTPKASRRQMADVLKKHLTVALIDRSDPLGRMSLEKWKSVEMRLLDEMMMMMETKRSQAMPTFDGAGWFKDVKIIKCNDQFTLDWCRATVAKLENTWKGAKLEVVDWANIPSLPNAKVLIPRVVPSETALRLLQTQNPAVPTADWKVLKVDKPTGKDGGQIYILQINKEAEDILYPRFGKMAWGVGSVYLRLKKRKKDDGNINTLETGEVEKDLGIDAVQSNWKAFNLLQLKCTRKPKQN